MVVELEAVVDVKVLEEEAMVPSRVRIQSCMCTCIGMCVYVGQFSFEIEVF